jgi:hypothetical protein
MSEYYFGATRANLFLGHEAHAVRISRVGCSRCVAGRHSEYIARANANASEDEKREAAALLTVFVEWDHPHHGPVGYGGMTLEELRKRTGRNISAAGA